LIGEDGKILESASLDPSGHQMTVETVSYSNGDVFPRICHRSRVLVKMGF
jgi:hypothetical protein